MKKLFILILTLILITTPIPTEASTKVPSKVTNAVERCVNENGRCIVVDQSSGKMYLFKQCKGQWKLKKSFRCIVSTKLCRSKHYFLHRSDDIDLYAFGADSDRWSYGIYVDCYEEPKSILIHSYTDHYNGRTWTTKKSPMYNTFGISVCEKNAKYIWDHYGDGTAVMEV